MRRIRAVLIATALAAASNVALGCGACIEDKVAATYDHAVVRAAIETHRQVVFVALDGREASRAGSRIVAAGSSVRGVQRGSVRYAASPPAFSFALAREVPPEQALAAFRAAVSGTGAQMTIVRVMRDGALMEP